MGDAVMMLCVSVPWWFYGYGAEKLAAWVVRLARSLPLPYRLDLPPRLPR